MKENDKIKDADAKKSLSSLDGVQSSERTMPTVPKIILASGSPRRKELLNELGIDFDIIVTDVDETLDMPSSPLEYVAVISRRKAEAAVKICYQRDIAQAVVIAADTIVSIDRKILGKPKDRNDAFSMLELLDNKWHNVHTGLDVAFLKDGHVEYTYACCTTNVKFKRLTKRQIEWYINTNEPFDKAGAYAIQGEGKKLIEEIDGDYNNVVGLPIECLLEILSRHSVSGNA